MNHQNDKKRRSRRAWRGGGRRKNYGRTEQSSDELKIRRETVTRVLSEEDDELTKNNKSWKKNNKSWKKNNRNNCLVVKKCMCSKKSVELNMDECERIRVTCRDR